MCIDDAFYNFLGIFHYRDDSVGTIFGDSKGNIYKREEKLMTRPMANLVEAVLS